MYRGIIIILVFVLSGFGGQRIYQLDKQTERSTLNSIEFNAGRNVHQNIDYKTASWKKKPPTKKERALAMINMSTMYPHVGGYRKILPRL